MKYTSTSLSTSKIRLLHMCLVPLFFFLHYFFGVFESFSSLFSPAELFHLDFGMRLESRFWQIERQKYPGLISSYCMILT